MRKMQYVSNDKQNALDGLLGEKTSKIKQIKIAEKKYLKRQIDEQTYKKIWKDADRDYWMTADEAKDYGMIDEVLLKTKKS